MTPRLLVVLSLFGCLGRVCLALTCPAEAELDATVLIFGAGISGITAARELYDNGITDIKIIEARDEIGGRMRINDFAGVKVESGANWIHQLTQGNAAFNSGNPIWRLAKETNGCRNLAGVYTETAQVWNQVDGNGDYSEIDQDNTQQATYEEAFAATLQLGENLIETADTDAAGITVRQGFQQSGSEWVPQTRLENLTEWYNFDFCFTESPAVSSLYGVVTLNSVDGSDNYLITDQNGYSSVVQCVAQGIEDKLMLETMVNDISWNNECVCANVTDKDGQISTLCGKYGVTTFSVGVLKEWIKSPSKFNPSLNPNKQEAIGKLTMGYYLKIFIEFPSRFWDDNVDYILRAGEERGYFPVIQPIGESIGNPNVMFMTVVSSLAERVTTQNVNTTIDEIMAVLRDLYGNDIPEPIDILVPDWITNPLYRGMYTNVQIGVRNVCKDIVAQPEGNLYFSGEALSQTVSGTTIGAYCTGLNVSEVILNREGLNNDQSSLPGCSRFVSSSSHMVAKISVLMACFVAAILLNTF